jgi:hypothetical protein
VSLEKDLPQRCAALKLQARMRSILLVSLVLNVALAVALVTWFTSAPDNKPRVVRAINAAAVNSNRPPIVKTNILVRPRTFTWQEIESGDYATYVQNLRALGMPEPTIRDIIVADVDQLFLQRKRDEDAKRDIEWWRSSPSPEVQSNLVARTQALEGERAALLEKLLGPDWDKGRGEEQRSAIALVGPVLGNLPEDVKAAVQSIAARSQERIASYVADKQSRGRTAERGGPGGFSRGNAAATRSRSQPATARGVSDPLFGYWQPLAPGPGRFQCISGRVSLHLPCGRSDRPGHATPLQW